MHGKLDPVWANQWQTRQIYILDQPQIAETCHDWPWACRRRVQVHQNNNESSRAASWSERLDQSQQGEDPWATLTELWVMVGEAFLILLPQRSLWARADQRESSSGILHQEIVDTLVNYNWFDCLRFLADIESSSRPSGNRWILQLLEIELARGLCNSDEAGKFNPCQDGGKRENLERICSDAGWKDSTVQVWLS